MMDIKNLQELQIQNYLHYWQFEGHVVSITLQRLMFVLVLSDIW